MRNAGILAVGVVVLVLAFVLIQGSGSEEQDDVASTTAAQTATPESTAEAATPAPATSTAAKPAKPSPPPVETVVVDGGQPEGGIQKIDVDRGDTARIKVTSDVADEIHLHGYDLKKDVSAGGSVTFTFKADAEGAFEMELEDRATQIATLEVR